MDEVVSDRVHPGGHVFSKGLHCQGEQPGFIFIRNDCPAAVALTFEARPRRLPQAHREPAAAGGWL